MFKLNIIYCCNRIIIIAFLSILYVSFALADHGIITQCKVGDIGIGDSSDKIHKVFNSTYKIKIVKKPGHVKEVFVSQDHDMVMKLSVDEKDKIFLIDVYSSYSTIKNIYPGSTLSAVLTAYGKGKINPTDAGYFVYFDDLPGIQFLIDNNYVPSKLRGIPDDVINEEQEKQILNLKNAKISEIQISCHDCGRKIDSDR